MNNKFEVPLTFIGDDCAYFRPITLRHLLELKSKYPEGKLVCGNTEIGADGNMKGIHHSVLISSSHVEELNALEVNDDGECFISKELSYLKVNNVSVTQL